MEDRVARALGVASARRIERLQSLWGGYGEAVRLQLSDGRTVVVKHVHPGRGSGRGHDRKLRSYQVELAWYRDWADRCGPGCRVPRALHVEAGRGEWLFVLEDLDAAGFDRRTHGPTRAELDAMLRWLARFHATFLGERPTGLWKTGTYWHLATRPDELAAMARGPLRDKAAAIDARLSGARFGTVVHGDAKPANFCLGRDGVAAVDFQYVGGGVGVKDVAYLLAGEGDDLRDWALDRYFEALREALPAQAPADAIEEEWRALYPVAWADFHRFLAGWSPGWRLSAGERAMTEAVLRSL